MRKTMIPVALVAAATMAIGTAGVAANPGHGPAVRAAVHACKQERQDLGREAFAEKYGRAPMRACVRQTVPEARNAARECRAEREELGVDAFREKYGTNENGRNAFGKCVSGKVSEDEEPTETGGEGGETPA